jgi:putative sterol carrier protein
MAEQPTLSENVTPAQFFEQLMPMGFAAQRAAGEPVPADFAMHFKVTGAGGGDWLVRIASGEMTSAPGAGEAEFAVTLSVDDWRDAVLGRNGAALGLVVPQRRPDRPDNSARARQLRGTLALELVRETPEPFRVELCFNGAAAPRATIKMKIGEYLDMQTGKLNGQEAFMTGKMKFEGDLAFLMQVGQLNA